MFLNPASSKPIYVQIAEWLENEILDEQIKPHERIYSQYQLADMFNINPATAAKGLNLLLEEDLVYKKRGLGMFVTEQAKAKLLAKRKEETLSQLIREIVKEAERLGVEEAELIQMITQAISDRKGGRP